MEYKTIEHASVCELEFKRSRFIGYARPVHSAEEATEFINDIRAKHRDATHNVYAYRVRKDNMSRYSDDGEPSGTAGLPVLEVLSKPDITDCAIVVTRYFGGTLLGTGGLVKAYGETASLAVSEGERIIMSLCAHVKISCDYGFYGRIPAIAAQCSGSVDDTVFSDGVEVYMTVPKDALPVLQHQLTELSCGRFTAEITDEGYSSTGYF